jgi:hypothetical protein
MREKGCIEIVSVHSLKSFSFHGKLEQPGPSETDVWEETITAYLGEHPRVTIGEIEALVTAKFGEQRRIAAVLEHLGWRRELKSTRLVPTGAAVLPAIIKARKGLPGRIRRTDLLKQVAEQAVIYAYEEICGRPAKASYNNSKGMRTGPFVDFVEKIDNRLRTQLAPGIFDHLSRHKGKLAHKAAVIRAGSSRCSQ